MEKQKFQFKTNINCAGCIASVKLYLDSADGVYEWNVDTASKAKILTVKAEGITKEQVIEVVQKAGFKAEQLTV